MTETAASRHTSPPRLHLTSDGAEEAETPHTSRTPCQHGQGVFALGKAAETVAETTLPSCDDFDTQEAVRNFQAYLDILREWDEEEKRQAGGEEDSSATLRNVGGPAEDAVESLPGVRER